MLSWRAGCKGSRGGAALGAVVAGPVALVCCICSPADPCLPACMGQPVSCCGTVDACVHMPALLPRCPEPWHQQQIATTCPQARWCSPDLPGCSSPRCRPPSRPSAPPRFAVRENILVVVPQWIYDSEQAGWCQDEAAYGLADTGGEGVGQSGGGALPPPPAAPLLAAPAAGLTLMDEATRLAEPLAMASVPPSRAAPTAGEPPPRPPSRLQRAGSGVPPEPGAGAIVPAAQAHAQPAAAQAAAAAQQAALQAQLEWDDETPTFLDAVRLRLLGCTPGEAQEGLDLARRGAAKRYADWRDDLHYLVVRAARCAGCAVLCWARCAGRAAPGRRRNASGAPGWADRCRRWLALPPPRRDALPRLPPNPHTTPPRHPPQPQHPRTTPTHHHHTLTHRSAAGRLRPHSGRGSRCSGLPVRPPLLRPRDVGLAAPGRAHAALAGLRCPPTLLLGASLQGDQLQGDQLASGPPCLLVPASAVLNLRFTRVCPPGPYHRLGRHPLALVACRAWRRSSACAQTASWCPPRGSPSTGAAPKACALLSFSEASFSLALLGLLRVSPSRRAATLLAMALGCAVAAVALPELCRRLRASVPAGEGPRCWSRLRPLVGQSAP